MRARSIKPGILKNEILGVADPLCTILFEGLWMLADREGRLEDRHLRIKAEVFPYRAVEVDVLLTWLASNGFIIRYEAAGSKYIQINNFKRHQNPHKNEAPSELPSPNGNTHVITGVVPENSERLGLTPDCCSLTPDSGSLEKTALSEPPNFNPSEASRKVQEELSLSGQRMWILATECVEKLCKAENLTPALAAEAIVARWKDYDRRTISYKSGKQKWLETGGYMSPPKPAQTETLSQHQDRLEAEALAAKAVRA